MTFQGRNLFADRRLKNRLGIVPQDMAFYDELNAMDNLLFWGGLYDVPRAELKRRAAELLELVELAGRAKEPVKNFSGGMKRRLNTAIGLLHQPDLLLLDEPTVGIDVQAKVSILDIIRSVGAAGTAVIFTTHQLAEVEDDLLAHRHHGPRPHPGPGDARRAHPHRRRARHRRDQRGVRRGAVLRGPPGPGRRATSSCCRWPTAWPRWPSADTEQIPRIMDRLFRRKLAVTDLKIKSPSLETVFLKLTGRSLRD